MNTNERYKFLQKKIDSTRVLILSLESAIQFLQHHPDENSKSMIDFYRKSIESETENLMYFVNELEIVITIGVVPEGKNGKERFVASTQLAEQFKKLEKSLEEDELKQLRKTIISFVLVNPRLEEPGDKYIEQFISGGLI